MVDVSKFIVKGPLRCPKCGRVLEGEGGPEVTIVTFIYGKGENLIRDGYCSFYLCPCGHQEFHSAIGEDPVQKPTKIVTGKWVEFRPVKERRGVQRED